LRDCWVGFYFGVGWDLGSGWDRGDKGIKGGVVGGWGWGVKNVFFLKLFEIEIVGSWGGSEQCLKAQPHFSTKKIQKSLNK
jgi:hypothetical protein